MKVWRKISGLVVRQHFCLIPEPYPYIRVMEGSSEMGLADNQIHSFINTGFIKIELPELELFHKQIDALREVRGGAKSRKQFLPRMPILQQVLRHEKVEGALTSLLGPDYSVHPHSNP